MSEPLDPTPIGGVVDDRPRALGLGRLVMAVYWLFGAWTAATAVVDILDHESEPWGPSILALVAGCVYLVAAAALTHNGRRMRLVGWSAIGTTLVAPVILWILGLGLPEVRAARSAWTGLGEDYYFLPLAVSAIGLVWMWWSNPRRIVELAEQVDRPARMRRR
ncbi:hypothetical protein M3T53_06550 [Actinomyces sp. B33]|uniref:hypothetical protein n=1 Tax=Actinomyces sp. B33 TaxID=2942131 RepID=UPI00233F8B6F|nr:hypothetical protein [Actinomyces sp. B33]MDC4233369.1 hypothetical protein [Actinomyces sp. B33]